MKRILFIFLASCIGTVQGQNCLQNPSFEGTPQPHVVPSPWSNCGGTSDTQPGSWGINTAPSDGSSYVSFLQSGSDSLGYYEGAGQSFDTCLNAGNTYTYSMDLAHSNVYLTASPQNCYSSMQVWLGNSLCNQDEMVWQSGVITDTTWQTYTFSFTPSQDWCYISFRPYWISACTGMVNILLDNLVCQTYGSTTKTNVTCNGGCDGTASIITYAGTPPFTYQWNDPASQTTQTAMSLCAGTYIVVLTDSANQTDTGYITITEPGSLITSTSVFQDVCDSCNQTGTVTTSNGTPPYTYSWNDPLNQVTSTAIGLCENNTYTVNITDANGCIALDSVSYGTVLNSPSIMISSITNANCGQADGGACIAITGGTPPYTYQWDDPGNGTTNCLTSVPAGTYNVTVMDNNACIATQNVTISATSSAVATALIDNNATCAGMCDGQATVSMSGGPGPFTYSWNTTPVQSSATADSLCAGTYTVTVTDSAGCITTDSVTLVDTITFIQTLITTEPDCYGNCNGSIQANVSGGTAPYTFLWSNGQTSNPSINLCSGTYCLTITDQNGCIDTACVTVTEPSAIMTTTTENDVSCYAGCDGSTTASVSGGTTPYTYLWNDPNLQTTITADSLCVGMYAVTIVDSAGCTALDSAIVSEPLALTSGVTTTNVSCAGAADGTALVSMSGGVAPYTYLWDLCACDFGPCGPYVTGLTAGTCCVSIVDQNNCPEVVCVVISEPPPIVITATVIDESCNSICDGSILLDVTGGAGLYSYQWSPGGSGSNLCPGNYTVTVTDIDGCIATAAYSIIEPDAMNLLTFIDDPLICYDDSTTISALVVGGISPPTFLWNNGLGNGPSHVVSPTTTTFYQVVVVDGGGCTSDTGYINVLVLPPLNLILTGDDTLCQGDSTMLTGSASSGNGGPYSYMWSNGSNSSSISVAPGSATSYLLTISDNCSPNVSDSITVAVETCLSVSATESGLNSVRVHPNPNLGTFTIVFNLGRRQDVLVKLYAISGQVVYQARFFHQNAQNKHEVTLPDHLRGMFLLQTIMDDGIVNQKVIVE
ncbi:MAG: T9SS type A sorting domain-containing protein [Flavobacteriales bacterium]|nr:T9SS type A sorting domain-containing protein [Flavobacteriales bacterium]